MKKLKQWYHPLKALGLRLQPLLLLAMRLFWGGSLAISGWDKWHHIAEVSRYFASLHIPFPLINSYLVAGIECLCGACLVIGFATRFAAIPVVAVLSVAFLTEHRQALLHAWSDPQQLIRQLPFNYLLTALILFAFGPGRLSLDRWMENGGASSHK